MPILFAGLMPTAVHGQTLLDELRKDEEPESALEVVPEAMPPAVQRFEDAIAALESDSGPFAAGISEQLLGLGTLLQQRGEHQRAADVLKRGVHVARINGGLYSADQIPLLRTEINSLRALGEFAAVDERQRYLYRVERRTLGSGLASISALMRQGAWQREAFLLELDEAEAAPQRLLMMWDLYRMALNQLMQVYGSEDMRLMPALEGMLQSQYMIAGYRGFRGRDSTGMSELAFNVYTSQAYKQGQTVLQAMLEINAVNTGEDPTVMARDMQRLADWSWWFGNRRQALKSYDSTWAFAMESDDTGALAESLFSQPEPLPVVKGMEPLPEPTLGDSGPLVLSFTVSNTGRVRDVERLLTPEVEEDAPISRLERLIRNTRFRPQFVEGEPTTTEGVTWSFEEADWQALQ